MNKGVWMDSISDRVALHHGGVLCAPADTTWLASALPRAYLSDPESPRERQERQGSGTSLLPEPDAR